MAKEILIVKKSNGIIVCKMFGSWYLTVNGVFYQYTEIINGQNEQAIIFKLKENNKYGFLYDKSTGEVGDVFLYNTFMQKEPFFTFK